MDEAEPSVAVETTVTDLKQWAYCHRIPYYRYVQPVRPAPTYKMERGNRVQEAVEALERRRGFRGYGLSAAERQFGVWLRSPRLGLSGKLDLLLVTPDACYPVDFKDTEGGVRRNHRIQLAAYALLAEETLGRPSRAGFIYLVPAKDVVRVPLTEDDRAEVLRNLDEIRGMIVQERLPAPTTVRARCEACEFRNYCADIW